MTQSRKRVQSRKRNRIRQYRSATQNANTGCDLRTELDAHYFTSTDVVGKDKIDDWAISFETELERTTNSGITVIFGPRETGSLFAGPLQRSLQTYFKPNIFLPSVFPQYKLNEPNNNNEATMSELLMRYRKDRNRNTPKNATTIVGYGLGCLNAAFYASLKPRKTKNLILFVPWYNGQTLVAGNPLWTSWVSLMGDRLTADQCLLGLDIGALVEECIKFQPDLHVTIVSNPNDNVLGIANPMSIRARIGNPSHIKWVELAATNNVRVRVIETNGWHNDYRGHTERLKWVAVWSRKNADPDPDLLPSAKPPRAGPRAGPQREIAPQLESNVTLSAREYTAQMVISNAAHAARRELNRLRVYDDDSD